MKFFPIVFFYSAQEFARLVGKSERTLRRWAEDKFGPTPVMIHGRIHYVRGEVQAWLIELRRGR